MSVIFLLAKFQASARFRLFAHAKRDIAVASRTSGGFRQGGMLFPPEGKKKEKGSLDAQKISAVFASPKNNSAWNRNDDPWI
jgi:hypothetical protein